MALNGILIPGLYIYMMYIHTHVGLNKFMDITHLNNQISYICYRPKGPSLSM